MNVTQKLENVVNSNINQIGGIATTEFLRFNFYYFIVAHRQMYEANIKEKFVKI